MTRRTPQGFLELVAMIFRTMSQGSPRFKERRNDRIPGEVYDPRREGWICAPRTQDLELFKTKKHRSMEEVLATKRRHQPAVETRCG